jgi:FeS assembly protein IscX
MLAQAIGDPVYWDDAYPIALMLEAAHPGADPLAVDRDTLRDWVVALPGFADDPQQARPGWLDDIQVEWLEIGGLNAA